MAKDAMPLRLAKVALLLDQDEARRRWRLGLNVFEAYAEEVLLQAGIPFRRIEAVDELDSDAGGYDIVVAALVGEEEQKANRLLAYMEQGGILVALANVNMLARRLGYGAAARADCGYACFGDAYDKAEAIRFLGAVPWQQLAEGRDDAELAEEFGHLRRERPDGVPAGAALQRFRIGAGWLERWAVDIAGTSVRMQQGMAPVLADGPPAPDGSAPLDEGLLKADDGFAMDWSYDRAVTDTGVPYFPHPYVDYWRELFAGRLIGIALERGLSVPVVDYWPAGIGQVAMLSHDSDLNGDANADAALKLLAECGVRSTWCMIEEGYSSDRYRAILADGHELALHYNAVDSDKGRWAEEEFVRQLRWFAEATGLPGAVSNKNHFTRFEGWGELFAWCEKYGIKSDQTRGPSKKGNVGMLFGTCHPYFPIAWSTERNRIYDVVEIGFLTQDLDLSERWPDSSVIVPFLDRVQSVSGVAHFLVHQIHIGSHASVRDSMRKIVSEARKRNFTFLTGKQVNDWQRARRAYVASLYDRISGGRLSAASACHEDGGVAIRSGTTDASSAHQPVVWIPVKCDNIVNKGKYSTTRFGHLCCLADWQERTI